MERERVTTMFRVKTVIMKIIIIVIMMALINDYDEDEDDADEKENEEEDYEEDTSSRLSEKEYGWIENTLILLVFKHYAENVQSSNKVNCPHITEFVIFPAFHTT